MLSFFRIIKAFLRGNRKPYILQLPSELLLEILSLLWNSAATEEDRLNLMHCLPLVCKTIAAVFDRASSQQVVEIASKKFYDCYMRRLSNLDRSNPINTQCNSLRFVVRHKVELEEAWQRIQRNGLDFIRSPLNMHGQRDLLKYFNNGKIFFSQGLLPNLTDIFIHFPTIDLKDPYQALFPHVLPKTVQNLHINYTPDPPQHACKYRRTPIRYPSIPHKLKKLTITGVKSWVYLARLWESLFEVEEFIVDGKALPVGEDASWGLDMNQALDMLELGCRGVGWNWCRSRPWHPLDEHYSADWGGAAVAEETVGQRIEDFVDPPGIRRLKSFSNLYESFTTEKNTTRPIRRTKSCMSMLPVTDYPYGLRVWRRELLSSYCTYKVDTMML